VHETRTETGTYTRRDPLCRCSVQDKFVVKIPDAKILAGLKPVNHPIAIETRPLAFVTAGIDLSDDSRASRIGKVDPVYPVESVPSNECAAPT
jgi:hypothetical protein